MPEETSNSHRGPLVLDIFATRPAPINRRNATRIVPMDLLCLGLSRTGTQSLREALFRLGYLDVYHQTSLNQNDPVDAEMWLEAYRARFEDTAIDWTDEDWRTFFDAILGHCMAISDVPCISFWRELMKAYPKARVIVTVRDDAATWYSSVMDTSIKMLADLFGTGIVPWILRTLTPSRPSTRYARSLMKHDVTYRACLSDSLHSTRDGIERYQRHKDAVQTLAQASNTPTLMFNVKEGWRPLCDFLELEPPHGPFPHLNDRAHYRKGTELLRAMALLSVFVGVMIKIVLPIAAATIMWFRLDLMVHTEI